MKGKFLGEGRGLAGLAHVRTFPRVDVLKATQQGGTVAAQVVRYGADADWDIY